MGVRTNGMWMVVNSILQCRYSGAAHRLNAPSAALEGHIGGEARRAGEDTNRGDVDDLPFLTRLHAGQEARNQPQRAKIVELHGALESREKRS